MNRMTPTLIAACLLASSFAVSAQSAPATQATAPAQADTQLAAQADFGQADATASNVPGDKLAEQAPYNCLQYTGSRIRTADRKTGKPACAQGPGRSYGRDDLDRTGQVDIADALRRLDPSIK
ncbi:hypothetical protein HIV01_008375 [Lysobacter arenosi]|uniref:Uncharacterized protein n=1 Tax=Lysobacter arenosi TaxID=2795387 RepID=A0ABX7RE80_9GAMM|nr:hypothetical protein [Lysobacter arenosi]QSX76473.1 hypothetical protein HIV01_008375 [Lysobacter arenosi]